MKEKKPKLRNKQVVINELAKVVAEAYAAGTIFRELDIKKHALQNELDKIIAQEVNN
jgi:hypothetical protein